MNTDSNNISAIALLTQVIEHNATYGGFTADDLLGDELDEWLLIFRSLANLHEALTSIQIAMHGEDAATLCNVYLSALKVKVSGS